MSGLRHLDAILARLEDLLLVALLGGMILLATVGMVLRWAGTGLAWIDPILRYGVLWLGLIGGLAATRSSRHIQIGAAEQPLPASLRAITGRLIAAASVAVCGLLAYAGWRFVLEERAAGLTAFGDVPLWILELIFPGGFALLALRYALQVFLGPPERIPSAPEGTP